MTEEDQKSLQAYAQDNVITAANVLAPLHDLVKQQADLEAEVADLTAKLAAKQEELKDVAENLLPQMMEQLGMKETTLANGLQCKIEEQIFTSIPKDKQEAAFTYLDENGDGGMIKREFVITFGKGEEDWAKKFKRDLDQRKKPLDIEIKRTVNAQTLKAWGKGKLAAGVELPQEAFAVFRKNVATLLLNMRPTAPKRKAK